MVFWGAANFTFIIQEQHLPPEPADLAEKICMARWGKPDPWTYHPWEYNPFNNRETLIEALVIYLGWFYGLLRLLNMSRIIHDDDVEEAWSGFWALSEDF
jgi:hypothetical protein